MFTLFGLTKRTNFLSKSAAAIPSRSIVLAPAKYDPEVIQKFPKVLEVVNKNLKITDLNFEERVAYFVALHNSGGAAGRQQRKKRNFMLFQNDVTKRLLAIRDDERAEKEASVRLKSALKSQKASLKAQQ